MSLHWRKQLFVEEYLAHPELNAAEVAVRCGYEPRHAKNRAYSLLKDPEVAAAIEHGQKTILEKACAAQGVTEESVIRDILEARARCVAAGDGAWQTQGRLKCNELLGKYLGMWQEKLDISFADELAQRLQRARQQTGAVLEASPPATPPLLGAGEVERGGEE